MTHSAPPPRTPELALILACLARIRTRLWLMRLIERTTLALLAAALLATLLLLARFLLARYPFLAYLLVTLPALLALLALSPFPRFSLAPFLRPSSLFHRLLLALFLFLPLAALVLMATPLWLHLSYWHLPAACALFFLLAAVLSIPAVSDRSAAIFVDQQVGLKERVATALEWASSPHPPATPLEAAFAGPLLASAVEACLTVRTAKVGYARLDRRIYALTAISLAVAGAVATLSPLPALARPHRPDNLLVAQKATDLQKILAALDKKIPTADPASTKLVEPVRNLVNDLQKNPDMTNLEALDRVHEAQNQLRQDLARQEASEKAKDSLGANDATKALAHATEDLKEAQLKAAQGDPAAQAQKDAAARAIQDAAKAAGDKLASGQMTDADKKQLASALDKSAQAAGGDQQLQHALSDAAAAAKSGDGQQLSKDLSNAGNRMGSGLSEKALTGDALKDAMAAADKAASDLGESGQPQTSDPSDSANSSNSGDQSNQANSGGKPGEQGGNSPQDGQGGQGGNPQAGGQQPGDKAGGDQPGAQANGNSAPGDGPGSGSTNFREDSGPGSKYKGTDVRSEGTFVRMYESTVHNTKGSSEKAASKLNKGQSVGSVNVVGTPEKTNDPLIDYTQELPAARAIAEDAINKQRIPPQYRDVIRDFYAK